MFIPASVAVKLSCSLKAASLTEMPISAHCTSGGERGREVGGDGGRVIYLPTVFANGTKVAVFAGASVRPEKHRRELKLERGMAKISYYMCTCIS